MTGEVARYVMTTPASEHHLLESLLANSLTVRVPFKRTDFPLLPDDGRLACGTGVKGLTAVVMGVRVYPMSCQ